MKNNDPIQQFWNAVIFRDYETVRKAIADGFDVNAEIPGKVAPITSAQPAEDMVMLKLLWEAGAKPATPWLEEVFADFASGGNGSAFKRKKVKPVGDLILHRHNGDEAYKIEFATIRIEEINGKTWLSLEIVTNGRVEKSLSDTADLKAKPSAQITIPVEEFEESSLVGKNFSLTNSYNEDKNDYLSTIYYVEHEPVESNEIEIVSRKKNNWLIKWSGLTKDVNHYDGSKPNARVEIEGWFSLETKTS